MPLTAELAAAIQKATVRSAVVVYGDLPTVSAAWPRSPRRRHIPNATST